MIFKEGTIVGEKRGSIGGVSFSRNKSGVFGRMNNCPVDVKSVSQMSVRSLSAFLSQQWRQLTDANRLTWINGAATFPRVNRLGITFYYSGFQYFCFINRYIQGIAGAILVDAPDIMRNTVQPLNIFTVAITTGGSYPDIKLNFDPILFADYLIVLFATSTVSPGINYPTNFKKICWLNHTFSSGSSIKNQYLQVFGKMPTAGQVIWFKCYVLDYVSGFHSNPQLTKSMSTV
jgi:hypothetical protein